jgi:hypothetical protein
MHHKMTNPATLAACGARENNRLGSSITPEIIPPHLILQVRRLVTRFGLPEPVAKTVAALAFSNGRAP